MGVSCVLSLAIAAPLYARDGRSESEIFSDFDCLFRERKTKDM